MNLRLSESVVVHAEFMDSRKPLCNAQTRPLAYFFRTDHAVTCKRCRSIVTGFAPSNRKGE